MAGYRKPSVKTLSQIYTSGNDRVTKAEAEAIRGAMGSISGPHWNREPHGLHDALQTIDEIINGFGVEYARRSNDNPGVYYINMGEMYATTVMFDLKSDTWKVSDLGTLVERGGFR